MSLQYRLNSDKFMTPLFRISPFGSSDLSVNSMLNEYKESFNVDFKKFLGGYNYSYTESGRSAIAIALEDIGVKKNDVVTIFTTSNNFYVSSCVTKEIERCCEWNRVLNKKTKAILVIHEFGFFFDGVKDLAKLGIPIIEDYAHSFNSCIASIGSVDKRYNGDYTIFSLPKFFPIQFGGILASRSGNVSSFSLGGDRELYIKNVLSNYFLDIKKIALQRTENYMALKELFKEISCDTFFELRDGEIPGAFVFKANYSQDKLEKLKFYVQKQGIECSVFYGKKAFFIPCHQNLTDVDLLYFYEVISGYFKRFL